MLTRIMEENKVLYDEIHKRGLRLILSEKIFETRSRLMDICEANQIHWDSIFLPTFTLTDKELETNILDLLMIFQQQIQERYREILGPESHPLPVHVIPTNKESN